MTRGRMAEVRADESADAAAAASADRSKFEVPTASTECGESGAHSEEAKK